MREGLREVPELPPRAGIVLLGEEPDVVPEREEPLEQGPGLVGAAGEGPVVREPEAAEQEDPLPRGKAILAVVGVRRTSPYTGRVVTFTNSEVFEEATFNYSRMFGFLWEEMRLPLHFDEDIERAEAIALAAAREATDDAVGEARRELERVRQQYPLQPADLEPQSYVRITDNWIELSIRFLVRAWGVRSAKDGITRAILARYRAEGISIASATVELVKVPELSIRPIDGRATRPAASSAQPGDAP